MEELQEKEGGIREALKQRFDHATSEEELRLREVAEVQSAIADINSRYAYRFKEHGAAIADLLARYNAFHSSFESVKERLTQITQLTATPVRAEIWQLRHEVEKIRSSETHFAAAFVAEGSVLTSSIYQTFDSYREEVRPYLGKASFASLGKLLFDPGEMTKILGQAMRYTQDRSRDIDKLSDRLILSLERRARLLTSQKVSAEISSAMRDQAQLEISGEFSRDMEERIEKALRSLEGETSREYRLFGPQVVRLQELRAQLIKCETGTTLPWMATGCKRLAQYRSAIEANLSFSIPRAIRMDLVEVKSEGAQAMVESVKNYLAQGNLSDAAAIHDAFVKRGK